MSKQNIESKILIESIKMLKDGRRVLPLAFTCKRSKREYRGKVGTFGYKNLILLYISMRNN